MRGETAKAWHAFQVFRDMGVDRKLGAVAAAAHCSQKNPYAWARQFDWHERVAAYDRMMDRVAVAAAAREVKKMTARHVQTGMVLQETGLRYVQRKLSGDDGLARLNPNSALRFIETGEAMERRARGVEQEAAAGPQQPIEVTVKFNLFAKIDLMAQNMAAARALSPGGAVIDTNIAQNAIPEGETEDSDLEEAV